METISIVDELRKCINTFDEHQLKMFNKYCLGIRENNANVNAYTLDQYLNFVKSFISGKMCINEHNYKVLPSSYVVYKSLTTDGIIAYNYLNDYWDIPNHHCQTQAVSYIESAIQIYKRQAVPVTYSCFVAQLTPQEWTYKSTYKTNLAQAFQSFSVNNNALVEHGYVQYNKTYSSHKPTFLSLLCNPSLVFLLHPDIVSYDSDEISEFAAVWDSWLKRIISINPIIAGKFYFGNSSKIYSGNRLPTNREAKNCKINTYRDYELPIKHIIYEEE